MYNYSLPFFARFCAYCSFLTVLTTLGIHLFFPPVTGGFEQTVQLYRNEVYILNRWWVILHCLLVLVAAWGIAWVQMQKRNPWALPGFLFMSFFALFEIVRQFLVLFYLNGLRESYVNSADPALRQQLQFTIQRFGPGSLTLFGLFITFFGLANLFLGISLAKEKGMGKVVSILLLTWACINFLVLGNVFWKVDAFDIFLEHFNYTFQPLTRLLMGIWLLKLASGNFRGGPAPSLT